MLCHVYRLSLELMLSLQGQHALNGVSFAVADLKGVDNALGRIGPHALSERLRS